MGQPILDTISSCESRYGNSPNFLLKSNAAQNFIQLPTQLNLNHHFESLSYSASTEFGQHSLRSSVENQQHSVRGFNLDQIRVEQNLAMARNAIILEESKEEDVSFNKTLAGQSPIQTRYVGYDHKSSIDDGTRSLIHHMRDNSQDYNGTYQFKNATLGGITSGARPSFQVSAQSTGSHFLKFAGQHTKNKPSIEEKQKQRDNMLQDEELIEELSKANLNQDERIYENKNVSQNKVMRTSLSEEEDPVNPYSTFKVNTGKNDPIRIDDNQFVTLSQIQEDYYGGQHNYNYQPYTGGRPSTISNVGGMNIYSDSSSTSNPTTQMNTPNQHLYKSRISPYINSDQQRIRLNSQLSQKCECCKGPLGYGQRPFSGLSNIETKNLNFIDSSSNEQQTPHLASEMDQSTKILSSQINKTEATTYKPILCSECQSKQLRSENVTPHPLQSDLRVSQLSTTFYQPTHLQYRSQLYPNDENINLQSNLGSQNQQPNFGGISALKATSSMLAQSDLVQSNGSSQQIHYLKHFSDATVPSGSSLQYLSQLSQNIGSQIKEKNDEINYKYNTNTTDNYKLALKSYMNRQFERSAKCDPLPYSRIFRERQCKRQFESLQSIKYSYAKTYEELEAMHANLLLNRNTA